MLRYIKTLLELDEFAVETASTGEEALGLLKGGSEPDLVLARSLLMPGMTALQTLDTGTSTAPEREGDHALLRDGYRARWCRRCDSAASDYLTKPFRKRNSILSLEKCIRARRIWPHAGEVRGTAVTMCFLSRPARP